MLIRIIPVGNISQKMLEMVSSGLQSTMRTKCKILDPMPIPQDAHNHWRKQYDAGKVLEKVCENPKAMFIEKSMPTLIITDADIYYKGLNFVFGIEDTDKSCCIVSTARLDPKFYGEHINPTILNERTVKESIHEIGHHLGLGHCAFSKCVMAFSPSVGDVDKKDKYFCNNCKVKASMRGIKVI